MDREILNYITAAKEHGLAENEIKQNLLDAGWDAVEIEDNFTHSSLNAKRSALKHDQDDSVLSSIMKKPAKVSGVDHTAAFTDAEAQATAIVEKTEGSNQNVRPFRAKKILGWIFVFILFLLILGGGFYVYTYGYYTPSQIWQKFIAAQKPKIYQNTFTLSYDDSHEKISNTVNSLNLDLKNVSLKFNGNYYINSADPDNTESTSKVQYTFGSGDTSFSTGFEYRLKKNILYLDAGSNPFLDLFTQSFTSSSGKKLEWLKLDLTQLKNAMGQKNSASSDAQDLSDLKSVFSPDFKNQLEKIWEQTKIIKVTKPLGHEKIGGIMTEHFENELDKNALKSLLNSYLDQLITAFNKQDSKNAPKQSDIDLAHKVISGLIDKLEIKQFETWIGVKDFQLYRVKIVSNGPSLISAINAGSIFSTLANTTAGERDTTRIADIKKIGSALQDYKTNYGGYPDSKEGVPIGLSPNYIEAVPKAPVPPDGSCSSYFNSYWYTPTGKKTVVKGITLYSDYQYDFCIGSGLVNYKEGVAKMTPANGIVIVTGLPCTENNDHCSPAKNTDSADQQIQKSVNDFLSKFNYSAEFSVDASYSDYSKIRAIALPTEYYDLGQFFGSAANTPDENRLADIKRFASALEIYYHDKNTYPKQLSDLIPNYLAYLPVAPTPPDGDCSKEDNNYTYNFVSANSFNLSFCLGAKTEQIDAGPHILSSAGIQ